MRNILCAVARYFGIVQFWAQIFISFIETVVFNIVPSLFYLATVICYLPPLLRYAFVLSDG